MLAIRLLKQFDLRLNQQPVALPSRPAQILLAYLCLNPGPHRREKISGLLWPDVDDVTARANLRQVLWRLRKAIGAHYLNTDGLSLAFNHEAAYTLDTQSFINDLTVYTGELLPGFYDDWITIERERLHALFEQNVQRHLQELSAARRWPECVDWAERWIALNPAPEPAYRTLMLAHWQLGDKAAVAKAYQRCGEVLQRELNLEPSLETQSLFNQLTTPSPAVSAAPRTHNLPHALTSFIGRERELAQLAHSLTESRLITLTGVGGAGKTRLALQTAWATVEAVSFPDGVWFIDLAPLTDPAQVAQAVASVLNIHEETGRPLISTLIDHLRPQTALILLDNCEHLIQPCSELALALVQHCPHLRLLATSREHLNLPGETIFQVPTLSMPDTIWLEPNPTELLRYDAVKLFCARAQTTQPGFHLTQTNALALAAICHRLDGLPLAIELAAARVSVLSVSEIAARLSDAFQLLTGGSRAALPRQQTLRTTIDWSYNLLTDSERQLLRYLAVFNGGWSLAAAEQLANHLLPNLAILDTLTQLVHKSLVVADHQPLTTRYRLLETIRQYALEKLAETNEADRARTIHLEFFNSLAGQIEQGLRGRQPDDWLNVLEIERDNLRTALSWAITSQAESSLKLAGTLGQVWYLRALTERDQSVNDRGRAKTLYAAGLLAVAQGEIEESIRLLQNSYEIFRTLKDEESAADCQRELKQLST